MKELENIDKAKLEIVAEKRKYQHDYTIIPHKGHTCYQLDMSTGEITVAKIEEVNSSLNGKISKKILQQKNCVYTSALNKQNAQKKFVKIIKALVNSLT